MKPAFSTEYARLWDLCRYARGYLLDEQLISLKEYTALVSEETMQKPGQGSPAPRRLESYDEMRNRLAALATERDSLKQALNQIASWSEGETVTSAFDEPESAKVARAALASSTPQEIKP